MSILMFAIFNEILCDFDTSLLKIFKVFTIEQMALLFCYIIFIVTLLFLCCDYHALSNQQVKQSYKTNNYYWHIKTQFYRLQSDKKNCHIPFVISVSAAISINLKKNLTISHGKQSTTQRPNVTSLINFTVWRNFKQFWSPASQYR